MCDYRFPQTGSIKKEDTCYISSWEEKTTIQVWKLWMIIRNLSNAKSAKKTFAEKKYVKCK